MNEREVVGKINERTNRNHPVHDHTLRTHLLLAGVGRGRRPGRVCWRLLLAWCGLAGLRLGRNSADVGRRLGLVLLSVLAVLGLQVVQDVGFIRVISIQGIRKLQNIEIIPEITEEVIIVHAEVGVQISLQQIWVSSCPSFTTASLSLALVHSK